MQDRLSVRRDIVQLDHALLGEPIPVHDHLGHGFGVAASGLHLFVLLQVRVLIDANDQRPVIAVGRLLGGRHRDEPGAGPDEKEENRRDEA